MTNPLWPNRLQHTRLLCPSLSHRVCSNSSPLSWSHHPTISSCCPLFSWPQSFPESVFSNELALHIRWPKYWHFSISPSNEDSGLVFFRIDCFDLLAVQDTLKSLLQHNLKASILRWSAFFMVQLSHWYMATGKTISLTIGLSSAKWYLCFWIHCLGLSQLSFQGARVF